MIAVTVRDLESGEPSLRAHDTLTVDVPRDFVRGGIFTVADGFRAAYTTIAGKQALRKVTTRPLSWRNSGETCLVACSGGGLRRLRHYRLCALEPAPAATPRSDAPLDCGDSTVASE